MANLGANGLCGSMALGLLSETVGLLQSCIEFQEVIDFFSVSVGLRQSGLNN